MLLIPVTVWYNLESVATLKSLPERLFKMFPCIYLSTLGAWLAEEAMANREEVCEILPFILQLANETFESQKLSKVRIFTISFVVFD